MTRTSRLSKRISILIVLITALISGFAFVGQAAAQSTICAAFAVVLRNDAPVPLTATIYFASVATGEPLTDTLSVTVQPGESATLRLVALIPNVPYFLGGGPGGLTIESIINFGDTLTEDNCTGGRIGDGRINDGGDQLGAPVAVYRTDQGIEIYLIDPDDGHGDQIFVATDDEVVAVGDSPAENTIIDSASGVALYRLTSGEFQINATSFDGTPYSYIFE
jgi:hypothetical protein